MSQRYNYKTKRSKPKENQLGIIKIYAFCWKNQQRSSSPGESAAGVTHISMRIHLKSCRIFSSKVAATLLSSSRKGTVGA